MQMDRRLEGTLAGGSGLSPCPGVTRVTEGGTGTAQGGLRGSVALEEELWTPIRSCKSRPQPCSQQLCHGQGGHLPSCPHPEGPSDLDARGF